MRVQAFVSELRRLLCVLVFLAFSWVVVAPVPALAHTVVAHHPRLYLTPESLADLQARVARPGHARDVHERLQRYAQEKWNGVTLLDLDPAQANKAMPVFALLDAIKPGKGHLEAALTAFAVANRLSLSEEKDDQRVRDRLEAAAMLFDWCHPRLNATARQQLIQFIEEATTWLEKKKQLELKGVSGGHEYHAHLTVLMGALAVQGESPTMEKRLPLILDHLENHFLPFYRFIAEMDGGFHMGWEYSRYYHLVTAQILDLAATALGEDWFAREPWLQQAVLFHLYGLKDDGSVFMSGDNRSPTPSPHLLRVLYKVADVWNDGIAAWWEARFKDRGREEERIWELLWKRRDVAPTDPKTLPENRLFQRAGVAVMRDTWALGKGESSLTVLFKSTPWSFFNHAHRDGNSFEMALQGPLAVDSGVYDAYKSDHWRNYYTRTVAHNTLVLEKSGSPLLIEQNDAKPPESVQQLQDPAFIQGGIEAFEDYPLHTYVRGRGENLYPAGSLHHFRRHFLFLRRIAGFSQPVLVVYDAVTMGPAGLRPVWLLHGINRPEIGKQHVVFSNGRTTLRTDFLLPSPSDLRVVGGLEAFRGADGQNHHPAGRIPADAGAWRVEARVPEGTVPNGFLAVMLPRLATKEPLPTLTAWGDPATMPGVQIADLAVAFVSAGEKSLLNLPPAPAGVERILIFGLAAHATYQVSIGQNSSGQVQATAAGTLILTNTPEENSPTRKVASDHRN
ncbi:MAG: heparinase II/III-family protein [Magnetococcus sp. DMHC-1]|nr:heparinase II/III family protein [Magnetococcales bacterium]